MDELKNVKLNIECKIQFYSRGNKKSNLKVARIIKNTILETLNDECCYNRISDLETTKDGKFKVLNFEIE